ncbi:hypothetical protein NL676_036909 [Syzygium grande]|nr:hypothetical protein NL676_036909 [Syzygium grande]
MNRETVFGRGSQPHCVKQKDSCAFDDDAVGFMPKDGVLYSDPSDRRTTLRRCDDHCNGLPLRGLRPGGRVDRLAVGLRHQQRKGFLMTLVVRLPASPASTVFPSLCGRLNVVIWSDRENSKDRWSGAANHPLTAEDDHGLASCCLRRICEFSAHSGQPPLLG